MTINPPGILAKPNLLAELTMCLLNPKFPTLTGWSLAVTTVPPKAHARVVLLAKICNALLLPKNVPLWTTLIPPPPSKHLILEANAPMIPPLPYLRAPEKLSPIPLAATLKIEELKVLRQRRLVETNVPEGT